MFSLHIYSFSSLVCWMALHNQFINVSVSLDLLCIKGTFFFLPWVVLSFCILTWQLQIYPCSLRGSISFTAVIHHLGWEDQHWIQYSSFRHESEYIINSNNNFNIIVYSFMGFGVSWRNENGRITACLLGIIGRILHHWKLWSRRPGQLW